MEVELKIDPFESTKIVLVVIGGALPANFVNVD